MAKKSRGRDLYNSKIEEEEKNQKHETTNDGKGGVKWTRIRYEASSLRWLF